MTDNEFDEILSRGYERRGTEFKGPGSLSAKPLVAKVVRAVLGMANQQDGGLVVVGVDEDVKGKIKPVGLSESDLATWKYDDVAGAIAPYADPFVSFELETKEYKGKRFVLFHVSEFDEIPV
ncbi:MAG TPA: ATP-binding protein, partial [Nitrospiria bacterium]|nr:ATP-binding protein [Nitrospiria bacterium]